MQNLSGPNAEVRNIKNVLIPALIQNLELRQYIDHVENGISLRRIAKRDGVHASTVLRRIRKMELRREDPLLDDALTRISKQNRTDKLRKEARTNVQNHSYNKDAEADVDKDSIRILRRLNEQTSFMVMSLDLPKAVVMRGVGKSQVRSAVLSRELLVKDWVERTGGGKLNRYEITSAGRASLKRLISEQDRLKQTRGFSENLNKFQDQHREWGDRVVRSDANDQPVRMRVNLRESPINMLGRKIGKDGKPFLSNELLQAGERMREDFELAQLGPRVTQNWDRFMVGSDRGNFGSNEGGGSSMAQSRLRKAMSALGPGLGDIVLRCCCFLEGMEAAEKRMGWSARSGKIVLRIALQRLRMHYNETYGGVSDRIG